MSKKPGRVVRISDEVFEQLNGKRGKRSWDAYLRRSLGLPTREKRTPQPLLEAWVLPRSGLAFLSAAKARGGAVMESVRTGNEQERPVRVREVI